MTVLESIWHYVCFAFVTAGFSFIGLILWAVVTMFFGAIVGVMFAWIMISFGCWFVQWQYDFERLHYPYLCPPPKW